MAKVEYTKTSGFGRHAVIGDQKIKDGDVLCITWPDGHEQIAKVTVVQKNKNTRGSVTVYDEVPRLYIRHRKVKIPIDLPIDVEASFFQDEVPDWVNHINFWDNSVLLPEEQIIEVLKEDNPDNYIVGVRVPQRKNGVTIWLGTGRKVLVPFSFFTTNGIGTTPDFDDIEPTDWGQALRLGDYEVAVTTILKQLEG